MTLDDLGDTGWALIKAFCDAELDGLEMPGGVIVAARRDAIQRIIQFIEANAP